MCLKSEASIDAASILTPKRQSVDLSISTQYTGLYQFPFALKLYSGKISYSALRSNMLNAIDTYIVFVCISWIYAQFHMYSHVI